MSKRLRRPAGFYRFSHHDELFEDEIQIDPLKIEKFKKDVSRYSFLIQLIDS
jgi:hypothetical protein